MLIETEQFNERENRMKKLTFHLLIIALMSLAVPTLNAEHRGFGAGFATGVALTATGAAIGAAASHRHRYYYDEDYEEVRARRAERRAQRQEARTQSEQQKRYRDNRERRYVQQEVDRSEQPEE
jgi:hypothetical protein